jgi:hypothetical protein
MTWPVDSGGDSIFPEARHPPATSLFTASSGAQDTDQQSGWGRANSLRLDSATLGYSRTHEMFGARPTQYDPGGSSLPYTKSLTEPTSEASEFLEDQQRLNVNLEVLGNSGRFLDPHPNPVTSTATVSSTSYPTASEWGYDWNEYQARNDHRVDVNHSLYDHNNEFPLSYTSLSFCSPAPFPFPSNSVLLSTVSGNHASPSSEIRRNRCSPTMMGIGTERVENHSNDPKDHSDMMRQRNALSPSYPMSGLPSEMGSSSMPEDLREAPFYLASVFSHTVSFVDNPVSEFISRNGHLCLMCKDLHTARHLDPSGVSKTVQPGRGSWLSSVNLSSPSKSATRLCLQRR